MSMSQFRSSFQEAFALLYATVPAQKHAQGIQRTIVIWTERDSLLQMKFGTGVIFEVFIDKQTVMNVCYTEVRPSC